jgi:phage gpG-like protein
MPFIQITTEVEGEDELSRAFGLMAAVVTDWRPFWPDIAAVFYVSESARFASEGFGAWPPLSDGYRKWKQKHYPGQKILSLTGALRESLTARGAGAIYVATAQELNIGTSIHYAKYHQTGTSRMPARPPVDLNDDDAIAMRQIALQSFDRYAQNLGFQTKQE